MDISFRNAVLSTFPWEFVDGTQQNGVLSTKECFSVDGFFRDVVLSTKERLFVDGVRAGLVMLVICGWRVEKRKSCGRISSILGVLAFI